MTMAHRSRLNSCYATHGFRVFSATLTELMSGDSSLRSALVRNALRTAEKYQASIVAKTLRSVLETS
jgi:hypothetical protein